MCGHTPPSPARLPASLRTWFTLAHHLLPTLGDEEPRQVVVAGCEVALDGPELVAADGMLGIVRSLDPVNPEFRLLQIQLIEAKADGFGDPERPPPRRSTSTLRDVSPHPGA